MAYTKEKWDIGLLKQDGSTKVGLMLVRDKNNVPVYQTWDDEYILNQQATEAGYSSLPAEKELVFSQSDHRAGFGMEVYDPADPLRYHESYGIDLRKRGQAILSYAPSSAITLPTVTPVDVTDGGLEIWTDAATLTNWTADNTIAKETTIVYSGSFSAKFTVAGATTLHQHLTWNNEYRNRVFIVRCRVYATGNSICRIRIEDGVGSTNSAYVTGDSTWRQLTVVRKLDPLATELTLVMEKAASATVNHYFDEITIIDPTRKPITCHADFNDGRYINCGNILCKLNKSGTAYDYVHSFPATITDLEVFKDNKLYIAQGWSEAYWEMASLVVENCEDDWNELIDTDVTSSIDTSDYKVGLASVKLVVADGCAAGDILATTILSSTNLSTYNQIVMWIKSSVALNAGDLQLLLDDTAKCATPVKSLDIPAISANTWTSVCMGWSDASTLTALISMGIKMVVDKGAFTLNIDDIRAEGFIQNTLDNNTMKYFAFVHTTADTMFGSDSVNTIRSTTNPANGGTAWTAQTIISEASYDITGLFASGNTLYITKEDRPHYIDSNGKSKVLTEQTKAIASSTGGVNSYEWEGRIYFPYGNGGLLEYDAGSFLWLNPSRYGTNIAEWDGRIIGLAGDEEYLFACVNGTNTIGILSGKYETIGGNTDFAWHSYQIISNTSGAAYMFISSIYQKQLCVTDNSATGAIYHIPLPENYGALATDTNRSFSSSATPYFTTPELHLNFKGEQKSFIKLSLVMSGTTANIYWTAHYKKKGDSSWTSIGNFQTSPITSVYIPVDGSSNKPVSTAMQFKIGAITNSTTTTPILYGYKVQGILYPARRDLTYCEVRCADNITLKDGTTDNDSSYAVIKATLEEAKNTATWPVTMYDLHTGDTIYVKFLPTKPFSKVVFNETTRNPELHYFLLLQRVTLS